MHSTYQETVAAIKYLEIPKGKLAEYAGIHPARVSDYLKGKELPSGTSSRIEEAVQQVVKVWTAFGIRIDLSDKAGFARAVGAADEAILREAQYEAVQ